MIMPALPEEIWRRRLESEYAEMRESGERFEANAALTEYTISLREPGLCREGGLIARRDSHSVKILLLRAYPYPGGIDVVWLTPLFHPNVREKDGKVCIHLLNDWAENQTVLSVVRSLKHLLEYPNPYDALNKEAADYYADNPDGVQAALAGQVAKPAEPGKPRIVFK